VILTSIDLNILEEALSHSAQKVLSERRCLEIEVIPGLPQMLTPQFYLSGAELPVAFAFGKIVPIARFLVVGIDQQFKREFEFDSEWLIRAVEEAWSHFVPNVQCQLGPWDSDICKVRRLPPTLNLRHLRYSVFVYRNGKPERAGYFDLMGVY
jgi:hypothetical protein